MRWPLFLLFILPAATAQAQSSPTSTTIPYPATAAIQALADATRQSALIASPADRAPILLMIANEQLRQADPVSAQLTLKSAHDLAALFPDQYVQSQFLLDLIAPEYTAGLHDESRADAALVLQIDQKLGVKQNTMAAAAGIAQASAGDVDGASLTAASIKDDAARITVDQAAAVAAAKNRDVSAYQQATTRAIAQIPLLPPAGQELAWTNAAKSASQARDVLGVRQALKEISDPILRPQALLYLATAQRAAGDHNWRASMDQAENAVPDAIEKSNAPEDLLPLAFALHDAHEDGIATVTLSGIDSLCNTLFKINDPASAAHLQTVWCTAARTWAAWNNPDSANDDLNRANAITRQEKLGPDAQRDLALATAAVSDDDDQALDLTQSLNVSIKEEITLAILTRHCNKNQITPALALLPNLAATNFRRLACQALAAALTRAGPPQVAIAFAGSQSSPSDSAAAYVGIAQASK